MKPLHLSAAIVGSLLLAAGVAAQAPVAATPAPALAAAADVAAPLAQGVDLPALLKLGAARSPKLRAARAAWRAAVEQYPQKTALPDPEVMFETESGMNPTEYRWGVTQAFPFPGTLRAAGDVALREAEVKRLAYEMAARDFIVTVKLSYSELLYLQRAQVVTRQQQELVGQILKLATARAASDQAKLGDVLKAQAQVAQLGYDVVLLRELQEVEIARLLALLDLPSGTPLGPAAPVALPAAVPALADLEAAALRGRQELQMAAAEVAKAEAGQRLARRERLPMFTVGGQRIDTGGVAEPLTGTNDGGWMVTVGVSIPLWFDKNRAAVREAGQMVEAASETRRDLEAQTRADARGLYFRLVNARRLVDLYERTLLPQARQALAAAETWSKRDAVADVSGFLETQSVWHNFNLAWLRATSDALQAQARLELLVGGPLPPAEKKGD